MSVGPLKDPSKTVTILKKIRLNTKFESKITIRVKPKSYTLKLEGSFRYKGKTLDVPHIKLTGKPSSLANLPGIVVKQIDDNVASIFKELLSDLGGQVSKSGKQVVKAGKKAGKGVKKGAKKAGNTIKNAFG